MDEQNAKPFTIKRITKTTDKFAAVCYIYEGQHFQDLCRVENPDGTFNFSEKCLAQLPYHAPYFSDARQDGQYNNANLSSESSLLPPSRGQNNPLVRYDYDQSTMPSFRTVVTHYWLTILLSIMVIILLNIAFAQYIIPLFRRRSSRKQRETCECDDAGNLTIGKIKFNKNSVNILGHGSKGTFVYKGMFEGSQECAVKRIVAQTMSCAGRELEVLRTLQNQNLVRYLATEQDAQFVYIALERAECTLRTLILEKRLDKYGLTKEDVCKQSALGLQHLHNSGIVHRDLKPENILVSYPKKPDNKRYIMITDFGLSKEISRESDVTSTAARYLDGTQGWMPPEIIRALEDNRKPKSTKAADIFSLGCVFYYTIFDGEHPFGNQPSERDDRIKAGTNVLDPFAELKKKKDADGNVTRSTDDQLGVVATDLISVMIAHDASERPSINSIVKYPLFWTKRQSLQFLLDVSDRLEDKSDIEPGQPGERPRLPPWRIYLNQWNVKSEVFGFNWFEYLSDVVRVEVARKERRGYNGKSLTDLLRLIRNKSHHFNDCSNELKHEFGNPPDDYFDYFSTRYPHLIMHVYKAVQDIKTEPKFSEYYEGTDDYKFPRLKAGSFSDRSPRLNHQGDDSPTRCAW